MEKFLTLLFLFLVGLHQSVVAQSSTFFYTGSVQTYSVGTGTILGIDMEGASGGGPYEDAHTMGPVTLGGRVQCDLTVTPGEVLYVYVGGMGQSCDPPYSFVYLGGYNGGGNAGTEFAAGGGGASDIRTIAGTSGTALSSRLVVAGGGGGGGDFEGAGGLGGGLTGGSGDPSLFGGTGGAGGTQSGPGSGGGLSGGFGIGGTGSSVSSGGGGGGYWGGNGGYEWAAGGGGSSYTDPVLATSVVHTQGYTGANGNGLVIITVLCNAGVVNGTRAVCIGSTTTLSDTVGASSGTWSSSSTTIATVNASSGVVSGLSAGTATITYSVTIPCGSVYSIAVVTVNPLPAAITGIESVCLGVSTALFDAATGGTWSTGSSTIATVVPAAGLVSGAGLGSTPVTYTLPTGCIATAAVTVTSLSTAITGTAIMCGGATTMLSEATTGGTWSSSAASVASVSPASGLVTGGAVTAVGTATITYTAAGGCTVFTIVTVDPQPGGITGASTVCSGATTTLFDVGSGTWSSSNTAVATVGLSPGIVYGVAPGTATITYTLGAGCSTTLVMTVLLTPGPISGPTGLCTGGTGTLADTSAGGIWTSSNTVVATIDALGGTVYAGFTTGTSTISYLSGSGCAATTIVTVNIGPLPISGTLSLCNGSSANLSDAIAGGSWSSSNTVIATADPVYGTVYSVSPGTATISYTYGSCPVTAIVTVSPLPAVITGVSALCVGLATTLGDATSGGTWSSSNATVASIVSTSGILTSATAGTVTITYTLPSGCFATTTETVNTGPPVISGVTHVCVGGTTALSDGSGGTWTSSNTAVATVGPTGMVTSVSAGTSSIMYAAGVGCSTTVTVTVNALPPPIGGPMAVCVGSLTALTDGTGTWSSGNTAVATLGAAGSGTVTGAAAGTSAITYTATGCSTHSVVTVNPLPLAITGALSLCSGATTMLSDLTSGGNWSSGATTVATISASGAVSGLAPGTSVITFSNPATGCSRSATVTVNPLPAVPSGLLSVCPGGVTALTDATTGGLWSCSAMGIATVVASSGMVSSVSAGTAAITYTLATGCSRTTVVTVNALPVITGPTAECVGAVIGETASPGGGSWASSATTVATAGATGNVTGVATGTTTISYTSTSDCISTITVTVSLSPTGITGAASVCAADTTTLGDAVGGGVWSSSNTAVATVGSLSGTVTGVAAGTTIMTYSLGSGCTVTKILSVNAAPAAITGGMTMCIGGATPLADASSGGVWVSGAPGVATVNAGGTVTGAAAGTGTVTYTVAGCRSIAVVTVNPTPTAITGTAQVCVGSTTTVGDAITGGAWSSGSTAIATIDAAGNISGISPGTATMSYSLGAGCGVTRIVTVNPISAIIGSTGLCLGATTALADATTGGAWSSSAPGIATVNILGTVTGESAGTATITYATAAGCMAATVINVNLAPSPVSGTLHVCAGAITALGNTAGGGTWTSSNTAIATIGSLGGVTGVAPGTSVITYSLGGGCTVTAIVTVNPSPSGITGAGAMCAGAATLLSDATTGGIWSSAPAGIATITGSGMASGVAAGTASITYAPPTGCAAITTVTVNPLPAAITGTPDVCAGLMTTLSSATSGGVWSSANTGIATADPAAGTVTGVSPGSTTVTYTLPTGCSTGTTVIINAAPAAIAGSLLVCEGSATILSDPPGSGIWSSGNSSIATVSPTGAVSGVAPGTAAISYTAGGCASIAVVTVNSLPGAISGGSVCEGAMITITDLPGGGTWSSSDAAIATIDETAGIVTGTGAGVATISYSLGAGCTVTAPVVVEALPAAITGVPEVCLGYATALGDPSGGGSWSSSNTAIATITPGGLVNGVAGGPATISFTSAATGCSATRLVTVVAVPPIMGVSDMCAYSAEMTVSDAITAGTWTSTSATVSSAGVVIPYAAGPATLTYTIPMGCYTTATFSVNPLPALITGAFRICNGTTATLSDASPDGAWSSSNTAVAPITASGTLSGVSAGTATVSYTLPTGCMQTDTVRVDAPPVAGIITGPGSVCAGSVTTLSDAAGGGSWSSSNSSASVVAGAVSGLWAGVDTIRYEVSNSCGSVTATTRVTVNPLPEAGAISGPASVCTGDSIVLADGAAGGAWSSGGTVTVTAGRVSGVSAGTDTVRYTVTNGCGTAIAQKPVTVNALANPDAISGILDSLCNGSTLALTDAITGGAWSSSNSAIINMTGPGLFIAASVGVDTISYSITDVCGTASANAVITVKPGTVAGAISGGSDSVCAGATVTVAGAPQGGTWASTNATATVTATDSGAIISGITTGADTILYVITGSCGAAIAFYPITVLSQSDCDAKTQGYQPVAAALQVWPNPNEGTFTVLLSSDADEQIHITITNVVGEKVKELATVTNKETALQLNDAAGVYFISASTAQGSNYVAKVVVNP